MRQAIKMAAVAILLAAAGCAHGPTTARLDTHDRYISALVAVVQNHEERLVKVEKKQAETLEPKKKDPDPEPEKKKPKKKAGVKK